ncbi:YhbY family RNA-binding protein [Pseudoscardovia suis]|uniref:RNA-binding protein n=1 Tax=Pseudoscardovia suis TaxID=987063 RepID=A0A261F492_9BIFI|nr:YhbY family RNA-binding protein [Pseudoscardovia suis]OZG53924.1 RNA-binding protein [Pseudoscardovia suis]PJJ65838.1 RNA-binding protein [Pseudoscardovia suis]
MTLTKKQTKQLRALGQKLSPLLIIGKNGITDATIKQADETIEKRELIKCQVLPDIGVDAKEAAQELCDKLHAEVVQVIGNRFVIYRESHRDDIEKIRLVRE